MSGVAVDQTPLTSLTHSVVSQVISRTCCLRFLLRYRIPRPMQICRVGLEFAPFDVRNCAKRSVADRRSAKLLTLRMALPFSEKGRSEGVRVLAESVGPTL